MKKSLYGFTALLLVFCAMSACNKFGDLPGSQNGKLQASAYKVDINQPDTLLLGSAKSTDTVKWNVIPSGFDSLITQNNKALVFFKKAGKYQVSATARGVTASTYITVSDSVYHPVITYNYLPLTGDQITLVPHFYNNPTADSSYLSFVAQTQKSYCGISRLVAADSLINNKYGINLLYIKQPAQCTIGQSPIATVINFMQNQPGLLPNGTFPLSVTLNGTTYTGSIVATSTTITFNWNYTTGVLIAPKQISR
ncbi:hypothetical protein [Mucilaginibacter sp.]|uniref:hypothetical protein n=1 Tax=Mucilaginibacter sp. TaxID=1882438 RepID=UPI00284CB7B3|nr:hypothetical protein [Mucilaginibacter sp.]MDR3696544.1 hypothetical protein [Mucilaginibacter sp.]